MELSDEAHKTGMYAMYNTDRDVYYPGTKIHSIKQNRTRSLIGDLFFSLICHCWIYFFVIGVKIFAFDRWVTSGLSTEKSKLRWTYNNKSASTHRLPFCPKSTRGYLQRPVSCFFFCRNSSKQSRLHSEYWPMIFPLVERSSECISAITTIALSRVFLNVPMEYTKGGESNPEVLPLPPHVVV